MSAIVWATPRRTTSPTRVPVGVVDGLEVVDVDEGDRQRPLVAGGALDLGEQRREQRLAVGDAGQPVDRRAVVGLGEGAGDRVDGRREPALEAAAARRDRGRVVARGDPLGGLDQADDAEAEVRPHDERRSGRPRRPRPRCGHDGPRPLVDPRPEDRRRDEEQDPERDRSRERQDPEQAHHARSVRAVTRPTDPPEVPASRAGGTGGVEAGPSGRSAACYTPPVLRRPAGNAREPGGQRSREKGASAVP